MSRVTTHTYPGHSDRDPDHRINFCVLCAVTSVSFIVKVKSILRWLMVVIIRCQIIA